MSIRTFGSVDEKAYAQLVRCQAVEDGVPAVLCADHHLGYSMPIGGVIGYADHVSPSVVGYDIACGNMAVRTDARASEINVAAVMDDVWRIVSFGIGRKNTERVESPVIDDIADSPCAAQRPLVTLAAEQLGTVGSGNHYVDLFEDMADGALWIGVHFGSRGLGHKTATWALEQATGGKNDSMGAPPVVIPLQTQLAEDYLSGMAIAGRYAYAGREWVVGRVLKMLGAHATETIHNHHNFAWHETHDGRAWWVHRKGATPAFPGQRGFVGGTMGEPAVILEGLDAPASADALYSTVHGAGRVLSRTQAAGKFKGWGAKRVQVRPGVVDFEHDTVVSPRVVRWSPAANH
jgi:tRNA-splicing ligase RtcB